jgi:hypothetical protein
MKKHPHLPIRWDGDALEMIIILALISLPDLLLSNYVSLPLALQRSELVQVRAAVNLASALEYLVPILLFIPMLVLWVIQRNRLSRQIGIVYLGWVTLRLVLKIGLIIFIIVSRPQHTVGVLLKDSFILWIINFILFGTWYWMIDAGGPRARRQGTTRRCDFVFPQQVVSLPGWEKWRPGFWDYIFLGFSSNTQFGMGDTQVLSQRAKFLMILQVTLSMSVIVFMASIAISLMR